MVCEYEQMIESWPVFSSILHPPQTDDDLERLFDFSNCLIDRIGEDENHVLHSLLDTVGTLIENYENETIPEPEDSAIDCLKYLMEERGLKQKDMVELGSPGVISEIFSGKRALNKRHIKALCERFHCNPAIFM